MNRATELEASVQAKEHMINMTREEIQPHVDSAEKHLKTVQELKEVKLHCTIKEEEKNVLVIRGLAVLSSCEFQHLLPVSLVGNVKKQQGCVLSSKQIQM